MELRRTYLMCVIAVMCAIIAAIPAASAAPTISVEPSYHSVSQGDTFTVNITVNSSGTEISGADYILSFNNIVLRALSQNKGPFLGGNIVADEIDNPNGRVYYGEYRVGSNGVTGNGTLATIEFEVRCLGVSELRFEDVILGDPDGQEIQDVIINNATVEIAQSQPPTTFLVSGYVFNDGGSDCNDPTVNIANLNISKEWTAGTSGNYYHLALSSCADVIADEVLCFNVTSPDGSSNITEHTVTQVDVGDGGFELNITLEGSGVFDPVITSCNDTGAAQDGFCLGDSVWVKGTGLVPGAEYDLWIQPDPVSENDPLNGTEDPSGSQETVTTDADGNFGQTEIWSTIPAGSAMNYDIVVDNQDGAYNAADDGIDSANGVVGIVAPIPELASIALLAVGLLMLIGLIRFKREE